MLKSFIAGTALALVFMSGSALASDQRVTREFKIDPFPEKQAPQPERATREFKVDPFPEAKEQKAAGPAMDEKKDQDAKMEDEKDDMDQDGEDDLDEDDGGKKD